MFKGISPWLRQILSLVMVVGLLSSATVAAAAGFVDVPSGHIFETEIDWLADEGITLGCNPPTNDQYCPDDNVTRGQMAAFLVRGLDLTSQDPNIDFTDDNGNIFENDIEKLATAGITLGCNPPTNDQYCPDDNVTRGQMAAFLYRALAGSTPPPPPPPAAVEVTTMSLANAVIGMAYDQTLEATGGSPPYAWEIAIGDLPDGLMLSPSGTVSGAPTEWGTYDITVEATDQAAEHDTQDLTLTVDPEPMTVINVLRANLASNGSQTLGGDSDDPALSGNGRYIAFESKTDDLVADDTNAIDDVFLHDTQTGETTRISVASDGSQSNNESYDPAISLDGRYIAFESDADNLVVNDTNAQTDVFVHDTDTGSTIRVSVASDGTEGNSGSYDPKIAPGGRYVTFESDADNLVANDTNAQTDVFVHDTQTGNTGRVSVASNGTPGNDDSSSGGISKGGRYVMFLSDADNLVSGDTNLSPDVFVRDTQAGVTTRVSVATGGGQANGESEDPTMSPSGQFIAFLSHADNLVAGDTNGEQDAFVHNSQTGVTTRVSIAYDGDQADNRTFDPVISADGRYAAFRSEATNLVPGDGNGARDIFVHDTQTGDTVRISAGHNGEEANGASNDPTISTDGRYVAFESNASNLVSDDSNGFSDVYRVELFQ